MNVNAKNLIKQTAVEELKIALAEGSLKGTTQKVAEKIINNYSEILSSFSTDNIKPGLENLVSQILIQIANTVCRKIALLISVILILITLIIMIITIIAGGNLAIPFIISATLIGFVWLSAKIIPSVIASMISKIISNMVYKAIQDVFTQ